MSGDESRPERSGQAMGKGSGVYSVHATEVDSQGTPHLVPVTVVGLVNLDQHSVVLSNPNWRPSPKEAAILLRSMEKILTMHVSDVSQQPEWEGPALTQEESNEAIQAELANLRALSPLGALVQAMPTYEA